MVRLGSGSNDMDQDENAFRSLRESVNYDRRLAAQIDAEQRRHGAPGAKGASDCKELLLQHGPAMRKLKAKLQPKRSTSAPDKTSGQKGQKGQTTGSRPAAHVHLLRKLKEQLCPEEESFGVTEVEVMMRRPSVREVATDLSQSEEVNLLMRKYFSTKTRYILGGPEDTFSRPLDGSVVEEPASLQSQARPLLNRGNTQDLKEGLFDGWPSSPTGAREPPDSPKEARLTRQACEPPDGAKEAMLAREESVSSFSTTDDPTMLGPAPCRRDPANAASCGAAAPRRTLRPGSASEPRLRGPAQQPAQQTMAFLLFRNAVRLHPGEPVFVAQWPPSSLDELVRHCGRVCEPLIGPAEALFTADLRRVKSLQDVRPGQAYILKGKEALDVPARAHTHRPSSPASLRQLRKDKLANSAALLQERRCETEPSLRQAELGARRPASAPMRRHAEDRVGRMLSAQAQLPPRSTLRPNEVQKLRDYAWFGGGQPSSKTSPVARRHRGPP